MHAAAVLYSEDVIEMLFLSANPFICPVCLFYALCRVVLVVVAGLICSFWGISRRSMLLTGGDNFKFEARTGSACRCYTIDMEQIALMLFVVDSVF